MEIACTLIANDYARQSERWRRLRAQAGIDRRPVSDGLQLRFRDDPGVERELRALVAVERDCCAWADWQVSREGASLVLHARSTGAGVAVLHGMFRRRS